MMACAYLWCLLLLLLAFGVVAFAATIAFAAFASVALAFFALSLGGFARVVSCAEGLATTRRCVG